MLGDTTDLLKTMGDPTRLRLLALLHREELTVAELTQATGLPQPRVSTHLGRLKDAALVLDRREGGSAWYRLNEVGWGHVGAVWAAIRAAAADDPVLEEDGQRLDAVLAARHGGTWADAVAGSMERHYSPGRTWESLGRGLIGLLRLGRVLDVASGDGAVAELLAPQAEGIVCLDLSPRVVERARRRLDRHEHIEVVEGDMHTLPFDDATFDEVLLMSSLSYTERPGHVLAGCLRVLRPGGRVVAATLNRHKHREIAARFDHKNQGLSPKELERLATGAGLDVQRCSVTSRERRRPMFEVVTLFAERPS